MTALLERITRHPVGAACAVALAVLVLLPGTAGAGACKETTKNGSMEKAQLAFRNATAEELDIKFYRGAVNEKQLKKRQTIGPGKWAQNNYAAKGPHENVTPIARIAIGHTEVMECSFWVRNRRYKAESGGKEFETDWMEGGCKLLNAAERICPTCAAICEKSMAGGKARWETQFTITK